MKLKSDPNFEEKLIFCLKNGMRNLVDFNSNKRKSENLLADGLLLYKVCNVCIIKMQRSCVAKNDLWFQK